MKIPANGFTHAGKFHADDVFATALLQIVRPDIRITRGFVVPDDFNGIVYDIGFGMFDAVRDAFCERPAGGWPANVVPSDLGLGPYDCPGGEPEPKAGAVLDLTDGKTHGWAALGSHVKSVTPTKEGLKVVGATATPAILCDYEPFEATDHTHLVVRMKCSSGSGMFRLYWRSEELQWCEAASAACPMAKDGEWHDYAFALKDIPAWRGRIFELRLQPGGQPPFDYVISQVRFSEHGDFR